jgi:hypothetical protein
LFGVMLDVRRVSDGRPQVQLIRSVRVWVADQTLANPLASYQEASLDSQLALGRFDTTWTNPDHPTDVSGDEFIAPLDALLIINTLNEDGSRFLAIRPLSLIQPPYYDVNGDGFVPQTP